MDFYTIRDGRDGLIGSYNSRDSASMHAVSYASSRGECTVYYCDLIAIASFEKGK